MSQTVRKSVQALSQFDRVLHRHAVRQTARHELASIGDSVKVWRLCGESDDFFATRIRYRLRDIINDNQAALDRVTALAEFLNSNHEGDLQ